MDVEWGLIETIAQSATLAALLPETPQRVSHETPSGRACKTPHITIQAIPGQAATRTDCWTLHRPLIRIAVHGGTHGEPDLRRQTRHLIDAISDLIRGLPGQTLPAPAGQPAPRIVAANPTTSPAWVPTDIDRSCWEQFHEIVFRQA